jgi:hypothetical protein
MCCQKQNHPLKKGYLKAGKKSLKKGRYNHKMLDFICSVVN